MKNVWLLNHYASEPGTAGGTRHFALARYLPRFGWRMHIIASSVEHATGEQRLPADESFRHEKIQGVDFTWLKCPQYQGNDRGRLENMVAYAVRTLDPRVHRGLPRPDAVVGSSVHPFAALAGAALATRFGVPFIFEVRDLWPLTLIVRGRLKPGSVVARAMRLLETALYHRATRIISLLPSASEYIAACGVDPSKVVWIPNGIDLADFPLLPRASDSREFEILYLGSHTPSYDLEILLQGLGDYQSRPDARSVRLRLVGDGPSKPSLIQLARDLGLQAVTFDPPVPKQDLPRVCASADAFVVLVSDLPELYKYGLSFNKIFDYLAGARPILIAISAGNNPVDEAGAGISVPAGDATAVADGIHRLLCLSQREREEMGRAGRAYAEAQHDFPVLAQRFAATLDAACGRRKPRPSAFDRLKWRSWLGHEPT